MNVDLRLNAEIKMIFNANSLDIQGKDIILLAFSISAHFQSYKKCIRIENTKSLIGEI
jgi:hypothetical protein